MYTGSYTRHPARPVSARGIAAIAMLMLGALATGASDASAQLAGSGDHHASHPADTAFDAMQQRGKKAMGVDQYAAKHHFTPLPDGARIQLETVAGDTAGILRIRAHMREIAHAFSSGDFSTPMFVHMRAVPGTAQMTRLKDRITYTPENLPRGGALRITTRDPGALQAVHEFIAFQQRDHHAGPAS